MPKFEHRLLEKIALKIPDAQLRIALTGAVFFAMDNLKIFEEKYGSYGREGLRRLMEDTE